MGTSVGTITLITPIAAPLAVATGFSLPFCVASVIGGAMFGDNLSFISDTTIAACNGQGCQMKDKFRENFKIALPAALVSLAVILVISLRTPIKPFPIIKEYNLIQIIPYLLVLVGGIIGINVFVVLLIGILSGSIIMLATGVIAPTALLSNMGNGASGMFETTMVAILVSAICALIREYGGFEALLRGIKKIFRGKKGGQLGMGLLVGAMDIAPLLLLWPIPLPLKWRKNMALPGERQLPCWIPSPAYSRALFPTGHRCWLPLLRQMNWGTVFPPFRSFPISSIRSCCSSAHWFSSS